MSTSVSVSQINRYQTYLVKGIDDETYQIAGFKISSKNAFALFDTEQLGEQISMWLSDYLVNIAGKTVLPPKVGVQWQHQATENSFSILMKDGIAYSFETAPPDNSIFLDLTGLNSFVDEKSNNVNNT